MPAAPFGGVQFIVLAIFGALAFFLWRFYIRTEVRLVRYGLGVAIFSIVGVLISYILALAITPFFSTAPDYRFKFWGTFIGLSFIAVIAGGLMSLFFSRKSEEQETGDNDDSE